MTCLLCLLSCAYARHLSSWHLLAGTKLEMNVPFNDASMDCWPLCGRTYDPLLCYTCRISHTDAICGDNSPRQWRTSNNVLAEGRDERIRTHEYSKIDEFQVHYRWIQR